MGLVEGLLLLERRDTRDGEELDLEPVEHDRHGEVFLGGGGGRETRRDERGN